MDDLEVEVDYGDEPLEDDVISLGEPEPEDETVSAAQINQASLSEPVLPVPASAAGSVELTATVVNAVAPASATSTTHALPARPTNSLPSKPEFSIPSGLPNPWIARHSKTTNATYYYNPTTEETTWEKPTIPQKKSTLPAAPILERRPSRNEPPSSRASYRGSTLEFRFA
jgi:hypothetical protein